MPSEVHNLLAIAGLRWLHNKATGRGVRGGFEVPLAEGYVADAVGLCAFQQRFADAYVGKSNMERDGIYLIVPEVICVFEAKATRSDFLATFGGGERHANRNSPVGNLHWCVCPQNVALPGDLPDWWGLLSRRGAGLEELRAPTFRPQDDATLFRMAYQVLWYAKNNQQRFARAVYDSLEH